MTNTEDEAANDFVRQAVAGLSAASRKAASAGHTLILVKDGRLIRRGLNGVEMLRVLPKRPKVATRVKKAKS